MNRRNLIKGIFAIPAAVAVSTTVKSDKVDTFLSIPDKLTLQEQASTSLGLTGSDLLNNNAAKGRFMSGKTANRLQRGIK